MEEFVSSLLLPALCPLITNYLPNLTLVELGEERELYKRFKAELRDMLGDLTDEFLTKLRKSGAVISGSLLVHFLLDEPHTRARDVDIFTTTPGKSPIQSWLAMQSVKHDCRVPYHYKHCRVELDETTTYYVMNFGHRFQLTVVNSPKESCKQFDFHCTRSTFDGDRFQVTPEAKRDLDSKRLTIDNQFEVRNEVDAFYLSLRVCKYVGKGFICSPRLLPYARERRF